MLFSIRGSGLHRTFPRIAVFTGFSLFVTVAAFYTSIEDYSLTPTPFMLIGLALGIFLGFRNNVAYDRYWEARKLWGSLVNSSRSFARQVQLVVRDPSESDTNGPPTQPIQAELIQRTIAFSHSLRELLRADERRVSLTEDWYRWIPAGERERVLASQNPPQAILGLIGAQLRHAWQQGRIADMHLSLLETTLKDLTDIQGGCERIKNTPFPHVYSVLLHQIAAFYCLFLPLGIIGSVGLMTPVVVMLISHAFMGLDEIGDEIEQPFGTEPNHLPLVALCRTVEINLLEALGATEVPAPLLPQHDILL